MSNANMIMRILSALLNAFCGGSNNNNHQQGQQQGYQGQQHQQPQQYTNQQQGYPGQYPPQQQQQQGQSWSQVAGGSSPQHHQNNHQKPHKNNKNNNHNNHNNYNNHQQPSRPHGLPAGGILGPHASQHQNQDQVNAANERYQGLRNQARQAGDKAHQCFAASQAAYQRGDGAKAHELSQEGKSHQATQDRLDDEAAAWIFNENNRDSPPGTIDLHGLYVKEALEKTEQAIAEGQRNPSRDLRVIVGKGIHSQGHVAKIKPAVQDLMQKYNLSAYIDPHNTGVLIVDLDGSDSNGRTRDAGGLVDQMDREQGGDCVIM